MMAENQDNQHFGSGTMTTQDIVKQSVQRDHPGEDWENIYAHLHAGLKSPHFRMLRRRDSLLFFQVESPVASNIHLYTMDDQNELKASLKEFFNALTMAGYTKGTGRLKNPALLRILRMAGLKVDQTKIPGGYSFEVGVK
jgi:hypothetical protein